ncbi:MAG: DUF885 domain-containing protein [Oceanicoccus sp.]
MKHIIAALVLHVSLIGCANHTIPTTEGTPPAETIDAKLSTIDETKRLNQWFAQRFEQQLQQSPMTMTQLGRRDKYDEIDDVSEAAEIAQLQWQQETVNDLKKSFNYQALSRDAKTSYDIWIYQYESAKTMAAFRRHEYVFTQMQGAHTLLPNFMINFHKVADEEDMLAYIKRIAGLSRAVNQLLNRAKMSASEGIRPPRFAYEGVIDQSKKLLLGSPFTNDNDADAPLWADVKNKISALLASEKIDQTKAENLKSAAKKSLLNNFQPAYLNLIAWMENDISNTSNAPQGASTLPNGEAYYNASLLRRTTLPISANEIHQLGLKEVARLRAEMNRSKSTVAFDGDLQSFFRSVKSDPAFFYANTDEGRQGYLRDSTAYLNTMNEKLPEFFGLLPEADLVVKRVEAFREQDGAAQHYFPGTPDGSRSGVYYVHLSDMMSMPKNEMESVAYHEGSPGHHMQISIAQELDNVPEFRTQAFFTSYVEGWALYAELLAKEMGAYQNPYADFGRLVAEMWRAIRLVVDTGIHSKGWTEEQAIQYFQDNSPIADGQIKSEVQRYFVLPGQATAYKIGMLKILELREKAQTELGDDFDIRQFHDVVLGGGSLPLPVLENTVIDWLDEK